MQCGMQKIVKSFLNFNKIFINFLAEASARQASRRSPRDLERERRRERDRLRERERLRERKARRIGQEPSLFLGLVLGWIDADLRVQIRIFQHFSKSTRRSSSRKQICKKFQNFTEFCKFFDNFLEISRKFYKILKKFCRIFTEFCKIL